MTSDDPIRQRLVLLTTSLSDEGAQDALQRALAGGDVASVLIDPAGREPDAFQGFAERLVPMVQAAGAAAIIVDDTRCAGRVRADGVHLTAGDLETLRETIEAHAPKMIVGCSGFETRHEALEAGEALPDYMMFGRFGQDASDMPHPKTLSLSEWWAAMVELPCIAIGAMSMDGVEAVAETNAEFVALGNLVFSEVGQEAERVSAVNDLLGARFLREKEKAQERASA